MRHLLASSIVCLGLLLGARAHAQAAQVTCENRTTFTPELTIEAPPLRLEQPDAGFNLVAVLGVADYRPFMTLASVADFFLCAPLDPSLSFLNVTLPENSVFSTQLAAQGAPADPQAQTITIGTDALTSRAFATVLLQGNRINAQERQRGDLFTLTLTDALRARAQFLHMALFKGMDSAYNPLLELVDSGGTLLKDAEGAPLRCDDVGDAATCYSPDPATLGASAQSALGVVFGDAQSAYLKVPLSALPDGAFGVRVGSNRTQGAYLLVLYFSNPDLAARGDEEAGVPGETLPVAQVKQSDDGIYSLTCDGEAVWTNGTRLTFPAAAFDEALTLTVVGGTNFVPIVAVVDQDGAGYCASANDAARLYAATLPSGIVVPQDTSVQVRLKQLDRQVFVGSRTGLGGEFNVFIEGLRVTRDVPAALVELALTPNLTRFPNVLQAFMVAHEPRIDARLAWVDEANNVQRDPQGQAMACDNAGNPENCYGATVSLRGFELMLGERVLRMDSVDAWLAVPLAPMTTQASLILRAELAARQFSTFTLLLRVVTS